MLFPQRIATHCHKGRLGLTLVELIIAISLSAIVMGACALCVSTAVKAWGHVNAMDTSEISQARIVSVLQRDIAAATLLNDTYFDGTSSRMTFSRLSRISFADYGVITIPCKVEWFRNGTGNLIRKESTITVIPSLKYESELDFGKCPTFLLSYAGIPLNTTPHSLNPSITSSVKPIYEWQSDWAGFQYYPAAVKVQLEDFQFLARVMVYSSPDSQASEEGATENE
jgi:hypothetical protein